MDTLRASMKVQFRSRLNSEDQGLLTLLAELLSDAEGMGLVTLDRDAPGPDFSLVESVLHRLNEVGVGRRILANLESMHDLDNEEMARLLRMILEALEESPLPQFEWRALSELFGADELATLLGISKSSLGRYAKGQRATPDEVAERLHFLAQVVGDLRGSYNEVGVRRWFRRPRAALKGSAPVELLHPGWMPNDLGPKAIRQLARSLVYASAT